MKSNNILLILGGVFVIIFVLIVFNGINSTRPSEVANRDQMVPWKSSFYLEGDIISSNFLYMDHGPRFLIILKPTSANFYSISIGKDDDFWGVYDKKQKLVYFVMSYSGEMLGKEVFKNVKITSLKEHHIILADRYVGNLLMGYENELYKFENENTIRL